MEETIEQLSYLYGSILQSYNVISEKQCKAISPKTFSEYTKKYFIHNIKIRCALPDVPEDKWNELHEKLEDSRCDVLFKDEEYGESKMSSM